MSTLPPRSATMRVTLADVAARAGVSAKTVSRVANRDANVSRATRERVEEAIAATGFRINHAARALAGSRSFLIGLFIPDVPSFYHSELFRAAARACQSRGYHLVLEEYDHRATAFLDQYERGLRSTGCDGLILPAPMSDDIALLDALDRDGVRYVRLAPAIDVARSPAVFADDASGVADLARHLWQGGRRRFGLIAGPAHHAASAVRRDAFVDAIAAAGGSVDAVRIETIPVDAPVRAARRQAAARLLASTPRPDAIFAFNDEFAIDVMMAAREAGVRLPEDLAIAGFDDSEAAKATWPPLTTIHQPVDAVARHAVEALMASPRSPYGVMTCPVTLVVRDSTRAVAK